MYSNKFVLSVLHNGQVLDEKPNGEIVIPFTSEYTIRLRNKNNVRCAVDIYIDGEHATTAGKVIVPANDFVDLERWLHKKDSGRKFKFVSLESNEAKSYGKDKDVSKNGVIEARFYLEKEQPKKDLIVERHYHHDHWHSYPVYIEKPIQPWPGTVWCNTITGNFSGEASCSNTAGAGSFTCDAYISKAGESMGTPVMNSCGQDVPLSMAGGTVDGSRSDQHFNSAYLDLCSEATVLKVQLKGSTANKITITPTTVSELKDTQLEFSFTKEYCTKCGNQLEIDDMFCSKCGTKKK